MYPIKPRVPFLFVIHVFPPDVRGRYFAYLVNTCAEMSKVHDCPENPG